LTPGDVVAAGVELVDEAGLAGFTTRALADRLGTYPATLYWHVGNRSQVLAAIVEHVLGEMIVRDALSCPGTGTTARSVEKEFNYAERAVVYGPSLASRSSALLLRRAETALVWGNAVKLRHGRQPGPAKSPSEAPGSQDAGYRARGWLGANDLR